MFAQSRRLYSVSPIKSSTDAVPQHKEQRMPSDIEIAQKAKLERISRVALSKLGIPEEHLEPYGHYKAKVSLEYLDGLKARPGAKLILVTAMTPTPAGEGKTTTTVGLGDALNHIGKKAMICLREPSLGPVFGMKGGAAGGGYAQVVPMEDINLHFTGDFNAIALANNLLAAMLDNHIHHGNELGIDVRRIAWRRVVDMNDRALRDIVVSLGGPGNGYPRQDGFDIVVASEVMAIFCLSTSLDDLKARLGRIVVGYTRDQKPVLASDLQAHGAMTVLLKDAIKPNLVQTLENNPAFIHGGPFANIAHGCNSVIATSSATSWSSCAKRRTVSASSTAKTTRYGRKSTRSRSASTVPPRSRPMPRCATRSRSFRWRATETIRFASRRPSTRFRPTRSCAAPPTTT